MQTKPEREDRPDWRGIDPARPRTMVAPLRVWIGSVLRRTGRLELTALLVMLMIGVSLKLFFEITDDVLEGDTLDFDRTILLALRVPGQPENPLGPRWLELAARDVTSLGSITVIVGVTLATIGYLLMVRRIPSALLVAASVGGGMLWSFWLKDGFGRARPDLVPHGTEVLTASFPSAHAMMSAVAYLTLGALLARVHSRRRLKIYLLTVAILVTLLIGASRVYLGVHWPTDVLAGWIGGTCWALACWLVALVLQWRGYVGRGGSASRDEDQGSRRG
jgi:undecaprenyl-diphosphatase